ELSRQRRRIDQVAKHDRKLAALGLISPSWLGRKGRRRCRNGNRSPPEIADRPQNFQSVPERNAKVFEMLIVQVGENGHINVVLGKSLRVLGHAELFEPIRNFLHRGHQGSVVAEFWTTATRVYADTVRNTTPQKSGQGRTRQVLEMHRPDCLGLYL